MNHCAGMIQKAFRGHIARKGLSGLSSVAAVKDRLNAVIAGWRIRRIFKTKEIA